jgi:tRNA U34 5-methylaminomethyl-2-thiouridine-forming methyltransferase MnmC
LRRLEINAISLAVYKNITYKDNKIEIKVLLLGNYLIMERKLVQSADGSFTLKSDIFGESYHSVNGALTESMHIFIQNGLRYYLGSLGSSSQCDHSRNVRILEAGFGTGLNALLTALCTLSDSSFSIEYTGIEQFPVTDEELESLGYPASISGTPPQCFDTDSNLIEELSHKIQDSAWDINEQITSRFSLRKIKSDLLEICLPENFYDIIYYDVFSPVTQPALWSYEMFVKIFTSLKPGGILVTYSAKGSVKNALREVGFVVSRLQGPPGKRHIIRAVNPLKN